MKPGFVSYIRTLLTIIFLSWGVIPEVFAGCNISGNGGNPATVQFSVPALVVNSDAVPGTIIATVNAVRQFQFPVRQMVRSGKDIPY